MSFLDNARQRYPDARHHCWAYMLGDPVSASSAAMSDDGEPSGTAGKPILNVLQHKGVGDVMLVVTRYFGGVKLGAGGLVRAYSAAAQQVMEQLEIKERVACQSLKVQCDFSVEQSLRHFLGLQAAVIDSVAYSEQVELTISLPVACFDEFAAFLASIKGRLLEE